VRGASTAVPGCRAFLLAAVVAAQAASHVQLHLVALAQGRGDGAPAQGRGAGAGGPPVPAAGRGRGPVFDEAAIARARVVYEPNCGFCHGNDARGGAAGPDLARSLVVIGDTGGRELGEFLAVGQPARGMPAFPNLTQAQIADIAVFLHERVEAARNRTPKDVMASVVGDPKAGAVYFNGRGRCSTCHSVSGDLAGIGRKYDPMALQDRFVNPRSGQRGGAVPASSRNLRSVTVTLPSGETIAGTLNFVSEFAVTLIDGAGRRRSFTRSGDEPRVEITDPLQAHLDLMRSYTDKDMHDLTAYLVTIK
jgi:cytochrome c oxidase cbb3-type subunit 3